MRSYILNELSNCIDNLDLNDFMKGYVYALICKPIYDDNLISNIYVEDNQEIGYMENFSEIRYENEVDIPEFMKKDNVVKLERR